jgi:hypothetical protein
MSLENFYPMYLFDTDISLIPDFANSKKRVPLVFQFFNLDFVSFYPVTSHIEPSHFVRPSNPSDDKFLFAFIQRNMNIPKDLPEINKTIFITFDVISANEVKQMKQTFSLFLFEVFPPNSYTQEYISVNLVATIDANLISDINGVYFQGNISFKVVYYDFTSTSFKTWNSQTYPFQSTKNTPNDIQNLQPSYDFWKSKHKRMKFKNVLIPQSAFLNLHIDLVNHQVNATLIFSTFPKETFNFAINSAFPNVEDSFALSIRYRNRFDPPPPHKLIEKVSRVLRLLEIMVFQGSRTFTQTRDSGTTNEELLLFGSALKEDDTSTDFLLNTSKDSLGPRRRVMFAPEVDSQENIKELTFDFVKLDFQNESEVTRIQTPNCVAETQTFRCLLCDVNYTLHKATNSCVACQDTYFNFLNHCDSIYSSSFFTTPILRMDFRLSTKNYNYNFNLNGVSFNSNFRTIARVDPALSGSNSEYQNSQFILKKYNRNLMFYKVKVQHTSDLSPLMYFFISYFIKIGVKTFFHDLSIQIWDYDDVTKEYLYGFTCFHSSVQPSFPSYTEYMNINFPYYIDLNGVSRNFTLKKIGFQEYGNEFTFEEIMGLVDSQTHNGEVIVPVSFSLQMDPDFIYSRKGPFHFHLLKESELTANPLCFFKQDFSIYQLFLPCPSQCRECQSPLNCLSCEPGYLPKSGVCVPCNAQCSSCSGSVSNCDICSNPESKFFNIKSNYRPPSVV